MPNLVATPPGARSSRLLSIGSGTTRIGSPGAAHVLDGVAGEIAVSGPPWRASVRPGAARLVIDGAEVDEIDLDDGTVFTWAGHRFEWRESPSESGPAAWRWLKAGLAVDVGAAEREAAKRAQAAVRAGDFRADAAAAELLEASMLADDDPRLEQRAGRLFRDLVMAPTMRGTGRAARSARGCMRTLTAFLLVQVGGLLLFSLLVAAFLLAARWRGHSLDGYADRALERVPWIPSPPDAARADEPR